MSTKIEWADITINPVVGCSKCSPGCENCYAERFAARLAKNPNPKISRRYARVVDEQGKWTGKIGIASDGCFADLYNSRKPKRVFIGSMCDLFHENVPQSEILPIVSAMSLMPQHTFMLLTKRIERARVMLEGALGVEGFEHIMLGVTVCNQEEADAKIPVLLQTPAAKRFVSVEPMLGPVDLKNYLPVDCDCEICTYGKGHGPALDWVICGGETGPGARPMHPDWVRRLRDQCAAAGTPFFFKGWGEWAHTARMSCVDCPVRKRCTGNLTHIFPCGEIVCRVGKRRSGRLLDGIEHNAFPMEVKP